MTTENLKNYFQKKDFFMKANNSIAIVVSLVVLGVFLAPTTKKPTNQLTPYEDSIITLQAHGDIIDLNQDNIHDSICMCGYCIENN